MALYSNLYRGMSGDYMKYVLYALLAIHINFWIIIQQVPNILARL